MIEANQGPSTMRPKSMLLAPVLFCSQQETQPQLIVLEQDLWLQILEEPGKGNRELTLK